MRTIEYIVIHCTGTSKSAQVSSILKYWKETKGWKNPGYHILVDQYGEIHNIFPFEKISNGVKGYNHNSIHISYIGGYDKMDTRTEMQKAGILLSIKKVIEHLGYCPIIQGHRDFPNVAKSCPNFNAKIEYEWITI